MSPNPQPDSSIAESLITRRAVLGGLAAVVLTPALLGKASASAPEPLGTPAPVAQPSVIIAAAPVARTLHTATALPNGLILVVGGVGSGNRALSSAQLYDPFRDVWIDAAPLAHARFQHAATLLSDGRTLVTGGLYRSSSPLAGGEIYDPGADRWTPATTMRTPRFGHALTTLADGHVIVTGGSNINPLSSVEIFLPAPNA